MPTRLQVQAAGVDMEASQLLGRALARIYDAVSLAEPTHEWLAAARESVGAEHAVLARMPSQSVPLQWGHCGQLSKSQESLCESLVVDPFYCQWLATLPSMKVTRITAAAPREQLMQTEIYQDLLRPIGGGLSASATWSQDGQQHSIAVCRDARSGRDYTDTEIGILQTLVPHLGRALALHRQAAERDALLAQTSEALDESSRAVVLLSADGHVRYLNQLARRLVTLRDGLRVEQGRIAADHEEDERRLQALIAWTADVRRRGATELAALSKPYWSSQESLTLRRDNGKRPLLVRAAPLAPGQGTTQAAVMLAISDPDRLFRLKPAQLVSTFGITRRESEIAVLLMEGSTLQEATEVLGISIETSRQYLKSLFRKLRVQRQSDLVSLLIRSFDP